MRYEIVITPEAIEDLKRLRAHERSAVRDTIAQTLRFLPAKTSRSRIKRLRGLSKPQYRLENDPQFLARIAQAQASYRPGCTATARGSGSRSAARQTILA